MPNLACAVIDASLPPLGRSLEARNFLEYLPCRCVAETWPPTASHQDSGLIFGLTGETVVGSGIREDQCHIGGAQYLCS